MTSSTQAAGSVTPAQLGFLAIFNPSLGNTDDTIDDQIVYYASVTTQSEQRRRRRRAKTGRPTEGLAQEEINERLRQIGLAQGMASFSRGFADGAAVDTIDTEKTRVVLHELEPGWWILASIDLTKIPLPPRLPTKSGEGTEDRFEYSTREMKPASLLLNDLLRAHNIFLMHHDSSLSALFVRSRRSKFVAVVSRYWDLFLSTWNVVLHGNPARDSYGGINIAASGELGVGVGEEDRGSSEREVLEGLVGRIEGLVDLAVSRFGEYDQEAESKPDESTQWLGTSQEPGPEDGAIFLGCGALSRKSLRDVTHWMEDLYTWGDHAYGLIESPTSVRRARRKSRATVKQHMHTHDQSRVAPKASAQEQQTTKDGSEAPAEAAANAEGDDEGKMDKMLNYMKLGYGTYWSLPGQSGSGESSAPETPVPEPAKESVLPPERPKVDKRESSFFDEAGHYLIGLKGGIEESTSDHDDTGTAEDDDSSNARTVLRTINVEIENAGEEQPEATIVKDFQHPASILTQSQVVGNMTPGYNSHDLNKARKVRVVVYVNRPFVFTFLFELRTDSLAWESLYRSLHYQLAPLKKQLLSSTTYRPERPSAGISGSNIFDLVWDPKRLTVHSTIPNIPETYEPQDSWSRADALSTHLHLLNIHATTRGKIGHFERTQKTARGWWIVWTRLLEDLADPSASLSTIRESGSDTHSDNDEERKVGKEIFLIRRASDHVGFRSESGGGGEGAGRLAQGIGVDTRRYVEELLSLL